MEFVFEPENENLVKSPILVSELKHKFDDKKESSRRSFPSNFSNIEIDESKKVKRRKKVTGAKVNYVKPPRRKTKRFTNFNWRLDKLPWFLLVLLVARLFFMDSGVIDYYKMQSVLDTKEYDLTLLRQENVSLIEEIDKIKKDSSYQRKLARDHLGVISKNEYLILFSGDSKN